MMLLVFFFSLYAHHQHLRSFPTRRSSDLFTTQEVKAILERALADHEVYVRREYDRVLQELLQEQYSNFAKFNQDRKSTRLNSSHMSISYAVFCWKKKKKFD